MKNLLTLVFVVLSMSAFGQGADLESMKGKLECPNLMAPKGIAQGVVTRVSKVPNQGNIVMVRHGNFLAVYVNLGKVLVKEGQQVTTTTEIGMPSKVAPSTFELRKGRETLKMEDWFDCG